jgi:AGZA family xanthine/uracil permease-like MFS transporter
VTSQRYHWAAPGDVNAFFGLMLDNVAGLLLTVSLLASVFEFPTGFALRYMVPGTAIGVFAGDIIFFWMALQLARRTGRKDITAMPLGLDTPSTFGMVFFVLGPSFLDAKSRLGLTEHDAAIYTWQIGICSIFVSGLFKLACAFGSNWIRRMVPRAGLLGSLAAIALVLISFLPLVEIFHYPVVGFVALAIILTTLVGRVPLPFRIPGALGALVVAGGMYHITNFAEVIHAADSPINPYDALLPSEWFTVFKFEWTGVLADSMRYMPVVLPFALATVVGGIDCTESAAAAGDEYDTGWVVGVEAFATLIASLCGGVIQTTPYIGHPAYKAMGGRAAYTLATALFIGSAGVLGYFGFLYVIVPKPAVFPILVFIGLEITSQCFRATPTRHYPAVAIACVPALAYLALVYTDQVIGGLARGDTSQLSPKLQNEIMIVRMLSSSFILTSVIWASSLAAMIDRQLCRSACYYIIAAAFTLFGIMHSPLPGYATFLPWNLDSDLFDRVMRFACGYVAAALTLVAIHFTIRDVPTDASGAKLPHA